MGDDVYQCTVYIFWGKHLMASSDELCATEDMLILKIETKLHQTLLKRGGKFDTVIHCQNKWSTCERMWWEMKNKTKHKKTNQNKTNQTNTKIGNEINVATSSDKNFLFS